MKNSSAALVGPPPFRWGNWHSQPDPTGKLATFLVSVFILVVLLVVGVAFRDSIFGWLLPRAVDGGGTLAVWLVACLIVLAVACDAVGTNHVRVDRVEINSSGLTLMYSHIPAPLGNHEVTTVHFAWNAVGRIVENHIDDGEGGHSFSIKVELLRPPKTGVNELDLSMDGEQEMHRSFGKIQALRS